MANPFDEVRDHLNNLREVFEPSNRHRGRVSTCEHGMYPPPRGWCLKCDKLPEPPHQCPKPAKVSFVAVYAHARGVSMKRAPAFQADPRWALVGWICSNEKKIAGVFGWAAEGDAVEPAEEEQPK